MSATKKSSAQNKSQKTAKPTEAFQEGFEKVTKSFGEIGSYGKGNYEAVVSSATVMAKGVEEMTSDHTAFAKESMETAVETMKTVASVKNPQDFMELQTKAFQSAFEANIAQMTKMTEMFTATAKEASTPLAERYTATVDMVQSYRSA